MTTASLSSGMTTTDMSVVNCEDAVRTGQEMQKDLGDESPVESMKTYKKCSNLANLQKKVKVEDKKVNTDKTVLFNSLTIIAEGDDGIEGIFSSELTRSSISLHYGSYDKETPEA